MKNQKMVLFGIAIGLGIFSIIGAYGSSTIINNNGISTTTLNATNINLSGSCSGCGISEGSYSNYNTPVLNTTTASAVDTAPNVLVGDDGFTMFTIPSTGNVLVALNGTTLYNQATSGTINAVGIKQSISGEYRLLYNNAGNGAITVFKNGNSLEVLPITLSQFRFSGLGDVGMDISPNGKYIALVGPDTGNSVERVIVLQGS